MTKAASILVTLAIFVSTAAGATSAAVRSPSAVPSAVTGTWTKTVTAATWRKHQIYYETAGRWALVISKRGITSIFQPPGDPTGSPLTTMRVAGDGSSVVFGPTADGFCPNSASYSPKIRSGRLALVVRNDACDARRVLLTTGTWKRK
jgi:hypothetical protein